MSNEMATLIKQRERKFKKKKNQFPYGIVLLLISLVLCIGLWKEHYTYAVCWILGIGIGIVLRCSRFCFTAVFRDPILSGNTGLLRGMLLAMMVSTVGFSLIQYSYIKQNVVEYSLIPGAISSVGIHVAIGAFVFGVGMVIAGGCSSGVLMRIGEGHALQWVVLLGFFIGTVLGAKDYPFWYSHMIRNSKIIYFFDYVDFKVVVIGQLIVLMILYKLALWYENKNSKNM
ncbi:YeeE/YedE thiosulfate transporter family protein [Tepidibacter thalassicus]|uniref:YeeE/YedE thiosulfate transporter family protein n=1 Tax=Tepidibacter thalassicus TaxID=214905 RepID=UPI000933C192|nr:YeeE/YedE thiosulfate transporter family protein [Tepidibacter thalassicus]